MTFDEILDQVTELLRRERRSSYRALKIRFQLNDEYVDALKDELIAAKRLAKDEDGKVLVWIGQGKWRDDELEDQGPESGVQHPSGERRQLTVMFCDLVGSTALSTQLDPEELREVVRGYQRTCAAIIKQHDGYIAQYLGDGLLIYFGYPVAQEEAARRAVQAGLKIITAFREKKPEAPLRSPLRVRIGIHTGLVVIGEIGETGKEEKLALGETPNLASRIQGIAAPNTVLISSVTARLVHGYFTVQELGGQTFKGIDHPIEVYHVLQESGLRSRLQIARQTGLTPLIGREQERALLLQRWQQAKAGQGHGVLICGEAGIGKSRLVQALTEQIMKEPHARLACRGSMYHRQSALYPVIELLQRLLDFQREDSPERKLDKLEQSLQFSTLTPDARACIVALLSLPAARFPLPGLSPQRLRQKTLESLLAWLLTSTNQQPLLVIVEDVHWIDPSTVELLSLLINQLPTARMLALFTFRPEFAPPWSPRPYLTSLTLPRLGRLHIEAMAENVAGGKELPPDVLRRLEFTTDGVPLFVEEFTKMIVESGLLQAKHGAYELTGPLPASAIPATLYDSLMARLDRLSTVKEIAQIGATIGREFPYEVLRAMSPLADAILQEDLRKLVEADLLYQQGVPPQATYVFKHALLREAAYQSLLKSTRQQHHRRIAHILAERFPDFSETQPELLAHHYTEAELLPQAAPLWMKAGQKAIQRFANEEAIAHFSRGRELLALLPATPERTRQEIALCVTLGGALLATKGYAAPEVEEVYTHARKLCEHIGETPETLPALLGLLAFYAVRAELRIALQLGEQALKIAEQTRERSLLLAAHTAIGVPLFWLGDVARARAHWEKGAALYDSQRDRPYFGIQDFGVTCHCYASMASWLLGYPNQARRHIEQSFMLTQQLSHPFSLSWTTNWAARQSKLLYKSRAVQEEAERLLALSTENGFAQFCAHGAILKGWALADQGREEEGVTLMRQGLEAMRTTGAELSRPWFLTLLAETYGKMGLFEKGLAVLTEALTLVQQSGEYASEPELHRLRGEFLLRLNNREKGDGPSITTARNEKVR